MPFRSSRPSRTAVLAVVAVLALSASACGGDDEPEKAKPKPAQTSLTGPGVKPEENFATAEKFFTAIADATPENLEKAAELAAPGSDAARHVQYLKGLAESAPAGGTAEEDGPGRYQMCDPTGTGCITVTDVLLIDGKVSSFKLDGKRAGAKR